MIDIDWGNLKDKLFGSFLFVIFFNFLLGEVNVIGCESGFDVVGGIWNFIGEVDKIGMIVFNELNGEN